MVVIFEDLWSILLIFSIVSCKWRELEGLEKRTLDVKFKQVISNYSKKSKIKLLGSMFYHHFNYFFLKSSSYTQLIVYGSKFGG